MTDSTPSADSGDVIFCEAPPPPPGRGGDIIFRAGIAGKSSGGEPMHRLPCRGGHINFNAPDGRTILSLRETGAFVYGVQVADESAVEVYDAFRSWLEQAEFATERAQDNDGEDLVLRPASPEPTLETP